MKILIVQLAFLGDVVLSTPVIKGVQDLYPGADIYFLTTPLAKGLLESDPRLTDIITYDKRKRDSGLVGTFRFAKKLKSYDFDLTINLHKSYRTAILLSLARIANVIAFASARFSFLYRDKVAKLKEGHEVERLMSILSYFSKAQKSPPELKLYLDGDLKLNNQVKSLIDSKDPYIVLAPGSIWETKRWPVSSYAILAKKISDAGYRIVVTGSRQEKGLADQVTGSLEASQQGSNLAGETSLPELLHVLNSAEALVCNDSMILHAASALKIPTVAVFCSTVPEFGFGPWENKSIVVEKKDLDCRPCSRHGQQACPTGTRACMQGVSVDEVFVAFKQLVAQEVVQ